MNIPEILVANGTGAVLVSFLLFLRVRGESKNSVGSELFCRVLVVTLLAQATETISFLPVSYTHLGRLRWRHHRSVCQGHRHREPQGFSGLQEVRGQPLG